MKKITLSLLLVLSLKVFAATAQTYDVTVSQVFAYAPYLAMYLVNGTITEARFTGAPFVRKVNSTNDVLVGNMTYGIPQQIYGHASVVFQYFPATNTINIPPGTVHITTWQGNQYCRVYENGTCNCEANANWVLCTYAPLAPVVRAESSLAHLVRFNTIRYLQGKGYTVTEVDAPANAAAITEGPIQKIKVSGITTPDYLFINKAKKNKGKE